MSTTMTIRLSEELKDKLEALAKVTARSKSFLAADAIADYIKTQEWQIQAIQEGIDDANAGNFVSHDAVLKEWETKYADALDRTSDKKPK